MVKTQNEIDNLQNAYAKRIELEEELFKAHRMSSFGNWEINLSTLKVTASSIAYDIYGFKRNQPLTLNDIKSVPLKKYRSFLDKQLDSLIKDNDKYDVRFEIKKVDSGEVIWVHSVAFLQHDENDKPVKVFGTIQDINNIVNVENKLRGISERLESIIEATRIGIWEWDINSGYLRANERLANIYGYNLEKFPTDYESRRNLIHPDDLLRVEKHIEDVFNHVLPQYSIEYRVKHHSGKWIWLFDSGNVTSWVNNRPLVLVGITQDITDQKESESKVKESELKYSKLVDLMPTGLAVHEMIFDKNGKPFDYRFLSCNKAFENQIERKCEDLVGKTVREVFPEIEDYWIDFYGRVVLNQKTLEYKNYFSTQKKYFKVSSFPTEKNMFAVLSEDITDEKKQQDEILYLSNHDFLTGLFNRRFFVESFKVLDHKGNYPLAVMMIDINGLKIINDAFGHSVGDSALKKVAEACKRVLGRGDVFARVGGDEFALLIKQTSEDKIEELRRKIVESVEREEIMNLPLSVATGFQMKSDDSTTSLNDLLKFAENHMYRRKLTESASIRNNAIKAILNTLTDKYKIEKIHSNNVSRISYKIGVALGLQDDINQMLKLAGLFHDIGKISIPDSILKKEGKLTNEEYKIMKNHTETGYQILRAADIYTDLAIYALYHHERFDGKGYPKGLAGEEIPLLARIICIADSFDAMTSVRTYKDRMAEEDAVQEIIRCSGTQFDEQIARVFVEDVMGYEWK